MDERIDMPCDCDCGCHDSTCSSVTSQYADVSLPIKLEPYVILGEIETECCGEPVISVKPTQVEDCVCSCVCDIAITQTICIKIPLEYGASANVGEVYVNCRRSNVNGNNGIYR